MELNDHDLRTIIERSAKGDAKSSKELYEYMVDKIFAYVRYRTNTREAATDITQDVFIDLFAALPNFSYSSGGGFYAYLYMITKRKLAQYYAATNHPKNMTVSLDEIEMADDSTDVAGAATNRIALEQALSTLDETAREVVVLHHWSRYSFAEIALLIEMKESAVRVRHHRALKKLHEHLMT